MEKSDKSNPVVIVIKTGYLVKIFIDTCKFEQINLKNDVIWFL